MNQTPRSATRPAAVISRAALAVALIALPAAAFAEGGGHGLVLVPDLPMLVALIVLFVLLVAPANALVFKPLLRVLDEREARTAGTRAKAEKLEHEAAAILLRYETAVREARDEGERSRRALLGEVRSEVQREVAEARRAAEGQLERARTEIDAALGSSRSSLRGEAQELARQAASQVLGRAL